MLLHFATNYFATIYVTANLEHIVVNENNCGLEDDTSTTSKGNKHK